MSFNAPEPLSPSPPSTPDRHDDSYFGLSALSTTPDGPPPPPGGTPPQPPPPQPLFGSQPPTSLFGQSSDSPPVFGQSSDNPPPFGQSSSSPRPNIAVPPLFGHTSNQTQPAFGHFGRGAPSPGAAPALGRGAGAGAKRSGLSHEFRLSDGVGSVDDGGGEDDHASLRQRKDELSLTDIERLASGRRARDEDSMRELEVDPGFSRPAETSGSDLFGQPKTSGSNPFGLPETSGSNPFGQPGTSGSNPFGQSEPRPSDPFNQSRGSDSMGELTFDSFSPRPAEASGSNAFEQPPYQPSESVRQSREEDLIDFRKSYDNPTADLPRDHMFGRIAKDIYTQLGAARVDEEDDLVIESEQIIAKLYREGVKVSEDEAALSDFLSAISSELLSIWAEYDDRTRSQQLDEYTTALGPGPDSTSFAQANFLGSLLLGLHHPSSYELVQPTREAIKRGAVAQYLIGQVKAVPFVLLEWMDTYHDPYPGQLDDVMTAMPCPASHRLYWDTVLNSLLRGRVASVISALRHAGWEQARHGDESLKESGSRGYSGKALENVERVVTDMVQILYQCPGFHTDWDITSSDWTLFRLKASQGLENLKRFAEGKDRPEEEPAEFEAKHFGMFSLPKSFSGAARKAQSRVPWDVYQHLISMYNLILGDTTSIIENAQDWCEATIGLTIWWNYGTEDRRMLLGRSQHEEQRSGIDNYLQKLTEAFYLATAETNDFQVNTLDAIEVGLASIFESDVEAAVGIIRSLSCPVSAGIVEIASMGRWLPKLEENLIGDAFDQDDMDVLGLDGPAEPEDIKDMTLIAYADGLAERELLQSNPDSSHTIEREGWEVAMEVLSRLDSPERSEKEIGRLIRSFPLEDGVMVEKLWKILNDLTMTSQAEYVAEQYANHLSENTHEYGEAIWYYALAHRERKAKDVLDLLISLSLLHSVAYPPESELDDQLHDLLSSPKEALAEISKQDYESSQIIRTMLSGYATLRQFYDLRDEGVNDETSHKKTVSSATKAEAASALIAVITSSDDNIRGGLYDEERGAVVSVDFLLALLGEAMVFVDQPQPLLSPDQIDVLLKAIEDLQTVPQRVYAACNEFFETVVASTQGLKGSSPMDLLRKSTSSLSGTSSFAMVGSSMMASQFQKSMGDSGVLTKENARRGWDWRKRLTAGMTSGDILRILRYGLARDVARTCVLQADGHL